MDRKKVLFVCLGNICRSPMAEAVFLHLINKAGKVGDWEVDSAGLGGWHEGNRPDSRALQVLERNKIFYNGVARQITDTDVVQYDYIFGMDQENMAELTKLSKKFNSQAKLLLLGDFDPQGEKIIRDPYYDSGLQGFEKCFDQCMRCCTEFLKQHDNV